MFKPNAKPLTVLIAPSGFKESLDVEDVCRLIGEGVAKAMPEARSLHAPMVDGGEGFTKAIIAATRGKMHEVTVTGPVGLPVKSFFGIMGGQPRTAVIEMAAAAGLSLVPRNMRDPMKTTSYGVGELICLALNEGVERILIGCGDSGINDGGAGMAQALGAKLLDKDNLEIGQGGGQLSRLASIDVSKLDPRLKRTRIDVAVNWHNILLGPKGVARVFGPQKGATESQVVELEKGLENYASIIGKTLGHTLGAAPGSGASGGLGAGLVAFAGGTLHPRFDIVMQYLQFDRLLEGADLVITAEGSLDGQSPFGKVPCEVASRARAHGIPVIAIAGTIGKGVASTFDTGIDAFASILKRPCTLEEAISGSEKLLRNAAEDAIRMIKVGMRLEAAPVRRRSAMRGVSTIARISHTAVHLN